MFKPRLYSLVQSSKSHFKTYKIHALLAKNSGLCLLPRHPDLNQIELVWSSVKECAPPRNTTLKLNETRNQVEDAFSLIRKDKWDSRCRHVAD